MNVLPRDSIHKKIGKANAKTSKSTQNVPKPDYASMDTDESALTDSNCFDESQLSANESLNVSDTRYRGRSTSAARNTSPGGIQSQVGARNKSEYCHSRTWGPIEQEPKASVANKSSSKLCNWKVFFVIVVIVLPYIMCMFPWNSETSTVSDSEKICQYSDLQVKYKKEKQYLWSHLKSGIEDILNGHTDKPGVYLFLHSGTKNSKLLITDIAEKSSSCFHSSMKPVAIEQFDFTSKDAEDDYGYVIEKYKQKIKEGNVILIANLNEIPPNAARALHAICDTYQPIVPNVMIFLSLVAEHKGDKIIDTVVDTLLQLWKSSIEDYELYPLITRVTDQVIHLQTK